MAVEDVPKDKIINERTSYFQVLYYIPLRDLYRWDDRYDYMLAVGYIPVAGQTIPPTLPPGPGSPFNAAETEFLNDNYASDAEVQGAISTAGSALGIANDAKGLAESASRLATQAGTDAGNAAGSAADAARNAANATSTAQAAQTAAEAAQTAAQGVTDVKLLDVSAYTSKWLTDKDYSIAQARMVYEDAPNTIEAWSNLNGWGYTANTVQVNAGKLYPGTTVSGSSGVNKGISIPAGGKFIAKCIVYVPAATGDNGRLIIGISNETAQSAPAAGAVNAKGMQFYGPDQTIRSWDQGTNGDVISNGETSNYGTGTYYVTVIVDATTISISAVKGGSTQEWNVTFSRTGWNVNNLYLFNNDTRQLTGKSFGALALAPGIRSLLPRNGIEDRAPYASQNVKPGGMSFRIATPPNYDSRKPSPLVIFFHGAGGTAISAGVNILDNPVSSAFNQAGYIVASASYDPNLKGWGSEASILVYEKLYQYVKSNYAIGGVVWRCYSMGGIESLLLLARRTIPCEAWIGTAPTASLLNNYNRNYKADITAAYGIAADGSDYAAKTDGHDPLLMPGSLFRGVPMYAFVPTDDTSVVPEENWNLMEPKIVPFAREYQRMDVTGGHGSTVPSANANLMVAFANKYVNDYL